MNYISTFSLLSHTWWQLRLNIYPSGNPTWQSFEAPTYFIADQLVKQDAKKSPQVVHKMIDSAHIAAILNTSGNINQLITNQQNLSR